MLYTLNPFHSKAFFCLFLKLRFFTFRGCCDSKILVKKIRPILKLSAKRSITPRRVTLNIGVERLVTFMCSGQCFFHILARENAIEMWRAMMGPTKVFKTLYTHPDTIRGTHGLTDTRNATHGSDSPESAKREMKVLFPDFNTADWYENEQEKFLNGDYKFNKDEFVHFPEKNT